MSGSASGSKAKSNNSFNFNQKIPKWQASALTNMYNQASNLFGQTNSQAQSAIPGAQQYANNIRDMTTPAFQSALGGGVYNGLNIGNQLMGSLNQSLNSPSNTSQVYADIMGGSGNNYADAMKAKYISDADIAEKKMLSNLDARAAASGMSGSSRHGTAIAQAMQDINNNLQGNLAQVGYDTFDKDLANKLNIAQMADQNTLSRQQLLSDMLGQQQGTTNAGLNYSGNIQNLGMGQFAPMMVPWDMMSNYAAAIGSPTVLSSGQGSGNSKAMAQSASGGL